MDSTTRTSLASFTSLGVGGAAEQLYACTSAEELQTLLAHTPSEPLWLLGYGANVLISDAGLPGTTILVRGGMITRQVGLNTIVAEAGVWWDELVEASLAAELWGLELMSGIPGSVGAAIVGNIAAYGQAVADTLDWVEVFDRSTQKVRRLTASQLGFAYRFSRFQEEALADLVILRAAFALSAQVSTDVTYQSVLDTATKKKYDLTTLIGRRQAILATRELAGSLWDYRADSPMHTAGSFFRNPMVSTEVAEQIMAYDETGKSIELLKQMNLVHGGTQKRVSAAHVLLAAGFARGQAWGSVRLHPDHILKLENTGDATAQAIYDVAMEIISTVQAKLGIELRPEVRFLGDFTD